MLAKVRKSLLSAGCTHQKHLARISFRICWFSLLAKKPGVSVFRWSFHFVNLYTSPRASLYGSSEHFHVWHGSFVKYYIYLFKFYFILFLYLFYIPMVPPPSSPPSTPFFPSSFPSPFLPIKGEPPHPISTFLSTSFYQYWAFLHLWAKQCIPAREKLSKRKQ